MWMHVPFMGGFAVFLMLPVLLLVVGLVFLLARGGRRGWGGGRWGHRVGAGPACGGPHHRRTAYPRVGSARDLLDQRYVQGEIDHEQYVKMKQALD